MSRRQTEHSRESKKERYERHSKETRERKQRHNKPGGIDINPPIVTSPPKSWLKKEEKKEK